MNRRGFFRGLFATPVAAAAKPLLKLLPAPIARVSLPAPSMIGEIVTTTLRNRSAELAANVMRNNALLRQMQGYSGYEPVTIVAKDIFNG